MDVKLWLLFKSKFNHNMPNIESHLKQTTSKSNEETFYNRLIPFLLVFLYICLNKYKHKALILKVSQSNFG